MTTRVLVIDMRNDLISTLMIIPDADIIYGISTNLYNLSIDTITQEFINCITCHDNTCRKFGHFHEANADKSQNSIISQSTHGNMLELTFNYNGKPRKYIYQHGNMFNNWHEDITDFQHIIIPFCPTIFDTNEQTDEQTDEQTTIRENYNYIKSMIKKKATSNPYFYIESDVLPIFAEFKENYTEIPPAYEDYETVFEECENCVIVSKIQINMDDEIWFNKNSITENRFIKCKKCNTEYKLARHAKLEDFKQNKYFECKNDTYCDFTVIYTKD